MPFRLHRRRQLPHRSCDIVAVISAPREKGVEAAALGGGVQALQGFELLSGYPLEAVLFIDVLLGEDVRERGLGDLARDSTARELLLHATAREAGTEELGPSELAGE